MPLDVTNVAQCIYNLLPITVTRHYIYIRQAFGTFGQKTTTAKNYCHRVVRSYLTKNIKIGLIMAAQ